MLEKFGLLVLFSLTSVATLASVLFWQYAACRGPAWFVNAVADCGLCGVTFNFLAMVCGGLTMLFLWINFFILVSKEE